MQDHGFVIKFASLPSFPHVAFLDEGTREHGAWRLRPSEILLPCELPIEDWKSDSSCQELHRGDNYLRVHMIARVRCSIVGPPAEVLRGRKGNLT
jgi:hypothetical protein